MRNKKYKKYISMLLIINIFILLIANLTPVNASQMKKKPLQVNAISAIAMDANTKTVLYEKNSGMQIPIASTTKIMTSLVALNYGDLVQKVNISKKSSRMRGSEVGYKEGESICMEELLYGLMLRSGNDAAIAIAEGIAGSVDNFSEVMNEHAYSIGATNSHFESPHGLDSVNHYSTAYDLALITCKAKEIEKFNEIVACKSIEEGEKGFSRTYNNINKILWKLPNANGVKTGYTGKAGKCLVTSVNIKGNDVVIVVLNSPTRWEETKKVYENVKENYNFEKIGNKNEVIYKGTVNKKSRVNLILEKDIVVPIKKQTEYKKQIVLIKDKINMSVKKGDKLGKLIIKDKGNRVLYETYLISDREINEKKNRFKINFHK